MSSKKYLIIVYMKHTDALDRLVAGNQRFIKDSLDGKLQNSSRRKSLVSGQQPFAIILGCADSRVVPELAFDTGLGELFTVRVAGNVANQSSMASIEYAVAHCGVKLILVLGHQSCGAVTAAMAGGDNGTNLNHLLNHVLPAVNQSDKNASVDEVVKANALQSVRDLTKKSSIISDAVASGDVNIVSAFYNLDSGKVDFL